MYPKYPAYRGYYSHSKIYESKYIKSNTFESPRQRNQLINFQNPALKKKSKSQMSNGNPLLQNNNYFKPKLNNLNITSLKQKSMQVRTQRSQISEQKQRSHGKKLQNYKIKKLQQKLRESTNSQTSQTNKAYYPQSPSARIISSTSQSKKNLSARKPSHYTTEVTSYANNHQEMHNKHNMNLELDTQKLNQFFQNKKLPTNIPQTTKSILQYNQYNKVIKKNQMNLRSYEESKLLFKKSKQEKQIRQQEKFEPYHMQKNTFTPKASRNHETTVENIACERKTVKKQKPEVLSIKDFLIHKQLGKGQNGKIYSAFHKKTGFLVALKHFQQHKIIVDYLIDEMKIQLWAKHPNILKAYGYIIQKSSFIQTGGENIKTGVCLDQKNPRTYYNIYIIMEKGEQNLFSLIKKEKCLSEEDTAVFTGQILSGLKYLHENKIIHRDLKPENIIIVNGVCKITDFGWSVIGAEERETFCGTLEYVSPEVAVGSRYDNKIDIWSVGVLIFEMLTGEAPYDTTKILQNPKEQYRKRILSRLPDSISYECKDLLSNLLKLDPKRRISIQEALNHKWIKDAVSRKTFKKTLMSVKDDCEKVLL